jgi:3-hydroxybutyryl-CoA dehydrogenase
MFNQIGVLGAGAMGRGIAQLLASSGQQVLIHDTRAEAIEDAISFNRNLLQRAVAKGKIGETELDAIMQRMQPAVDLAALKDCDLVIEAIVELMGVRQKLFGQIEEIVRGERTDDNVVQNLVNLAEHAGHFAAITPDTPGFLVNHAGRAFGTEALRMPSEGVATPAQIDRILRDGPGFRMGPFELFDLTGLDVSHAVMESVYQQFYHDPRYTPPFIAAQRVAAGLLGHKTGQGFYRYQDGQKIEPQEPAIESVLVDRPFWLHSEEPTLRANVASVLAAGGVALEQGPVPSNEAICLITPLGDDCSTALTQLQLALGYPKGPLAFGEPRYRPSPWLRRRVQLDLPLTTPNFQE